jgi:DNA-binding MarR family transcriptional regulator
VRSLARAARLLERASGTLGLAHYRVLCAIAAGEDRASRLARRFELGRPTISAAVDALCREGLVERSVATTDQRAFDLALTSEGRAVLDAVEQAMVDVLEDLCSRLPSSAEALGVLGTLGALGAALDARAAALDARGAAGRAEPASMRQTAQRPPIPGRA